MCVKVSRVRGEVIKELYGGREWPWTSGEPAANVLNFHNGSLTVVMARGFPIRTATLY